MPDTLQGEHEELASCSGTLYMPTFSARADSAKYVDIYYPKPQGFDPKWVLRSCLDMCLLVPPGLSKWSLPPWCLPGASQAVQVVLSCLPGASLVPPRLSKWSFPASLVVPGASWCLLVPPGLSKWTFLPPWRLVGCPNGPFLPPWCLLGASQAVQLVRIPILDGRRILSKF